MLGSDALLTSVQLRAEVSSYRKRTEIALQACSLDGLVVARIRSRTMMAPVVCVGSGDRCTGYVVVLRELPPRCTHQAGITRIR
jgi:hypothetical protein